MIAGATAPRPSLPAYAVIYGSGEGIKTREFQEYELEKAIKMSMEYGGKIKTFNRRVAK